MAEDWTEKDEQTYKPLRNKLLRIQAKQRRDKSRVRRYTHRKTIGKKVQETQQV